MDLTLAALVISMDNPASAVFFSGANVHYGFSLLAVFCSLLALDCVVPLHVLYNPSVGFVFFENMWRNSPNLIPGGYGVSIRPNIPVFSKFLSFSPVDTLTRCKFFAVFAACRSRIRMFFPSPVEFNKSTFSSFLSPDSDPSPSRVCRPQNSWVDEANFCETFCEREQVFFSRLASSSCLSIANFHGSLVLSLPRPKVRFGRTLGNIFRVLQTHLQMCVVSFHKPFPSVSSHVSTRYCGMFVNVLFHVQKCEFLTLTLYLPYILFVGSLLLTLRAVPGMSHDLLKIVLAFEHRPLPLSCYEVATHWDHLRFLEIVYSNW